MAARKTVKRKKKAVRNPIKEERTDNEIMFWFANHLMSYFGDDGDDDRIIADLREMFPRYPFVEENFRRGLDIAIKLPGKDRRKIVQHYANRRANTAEQATAWLVNLRDKLFAG
jgi:hypothetical protein